MYIVKVSNLQRWISEIHLKQFFNQCGVIVDAKVVLNPDTLRQQGYGYITFADDDSINRALAKNGSLFDGAAIDVKMYDANEQEVAVV